MLTFDDFKKMELKVALIESVEPHPNADKLYVLGVKVGEMRKNLVAGIRPFYTADELKGKKIVIVNNLAPATIRGIESQGMLLAASDGDQLAVLTLERDIPDGANVR